jgi:hypothetical protein
MRELDPDANSIALGLALSEEHSNSCASWCGMHAWQSKDATPIEKQAGVCMQKRRGPYPGPPDPCARQGKRCADYGECAETVLSHVADTPAIAREWERLVTKCVSECTSNSDEGPRPTCRVVYADACRGRIGVVCATPKEHGPGSTLVASELALSEP